MLEVLLFVPIETRDIEVVHVRVALLELRDHISEVDYFIHLVKLRIVKLVTELIIAIIIFVIIFIRQDLTVIIFILNDGIMFILALFILFFLKSFLSDHYGLLTEEDCCLNKAWKLILDAGRKLTLIHLH